MRQWAASVFLAGFLCCHEAEASPFVTDEEERQAIAASDTLAARRGDELFLIQDKGGLILKNETECRRPERCIGYRYAGTLADERFHVVDVSFWEGGEYRLISRQSGTTTSVYGKPYLSPDGMTIASPNATDGYGVNGIFLWRIENGEIVPVYSNESGGLYDFKEWLDADTLALTKHTRLPTSDCPNKMVSLTVKLVRNTDTWSLDEKMDEPTLRCSP